MLKEDLRADMMARRLGLSPAEQAALSRPAQEAIIRSAPFERAGLLLLYEPFRGEAQTGLIAAAALAAGKRLALPRVQPRPPRLWLHRWDGTPGSLVKGAYGLREPDPAWPPVAPGEVDLVVVPGTAFDPAGYRLGYGGGYYDRLLPEIRTANPAARFIGIGYPFQLVTALPHEVHDVALDAIAIAAGLFPATA